MSGEESGLQEHGETRYLHPRLCKVVEENPVTKDRYGRTVAFIKVGDRVLNEDLIRQGLAWVYTRYCNRPICAEWKKLEVKARQAKQGLWSMPNAVPPWEWKRLGFYSIPRRLWEGCQYYRPAYLE